MTKEELLKYDGNAPHQDLTEGLMIAAGGTSRYFNTGEWRTNTPVINEDLCRDCLICCMVCPDSSIPATSEGKRGPFDYEHCKGCGICAKSCPFDAITMKEGR